MADLAPAAAVIVELGQAWASSSVNCVPFRHLPMLETPAGRVVGFYDAAGQVVLQALDPASRPLRRLEVPSPVRPHDAHACISLGLDRAGGLHAVFGAHASQAWHIRAAGDLDQATPEPRPLAERVPTPFTYPMLLPPTPACDLALLFREGGPWAGELRLRRWDAREERFADDEVPLVSGRTSRPLAGPYANTPVALPDGRLALFLVWRLDQRATSAGAVANIGIDLVLLDTTMTALSSTEGITLQPPLTPVHSPRIWPVPVGANLINQAGAAAGPDGQPMALTYWNDAEGIPQYHLLWRAGGAWRCTALSRFRTRFALQGRGTLPLPHSRPCLLVRPDGTTLCLFRSVEHGNRLVATIAPPPYEDAGRHRTIVLVDADLGHYEPVVDAAALRERGALAVYVQACGQGMGDAARPEAAAPARLHVWSPSQLEGAVFQDPGRRWRGLPQRRRGAPG